MFRMLIATYSKEKRKSGLTQVNPHRRYGYKG